MAYEFDQNIIDAISDSKLMAYQKSRDSLSRILRTLEEIKHEKNNHDSLVDIYSNLLEAEAYIQDSIEKLDKVLQNPSELKEIVMVKFVCNDDRGE